MSKVCKTPAAEESLLAIHGAQDVPRAFQKRFP